MQKSKVITVLIIVIILSVLLLFWNFEIRKNRYNYSWQDVINFANNCEIIDGWIAHSDDVKIVLKNGKEFIIKQPEGGDHIFSILNKNTEKCGEISFGME